MSSAILENSLSQAESRAKICLLGRKSKHRQWQWCREHSDLPWASQQVYCSRGMFSWALNISCGWVLFPGGCCTVSSFLLPSCNPLAQYPLVLYLIILSSVFHCRPMSLFALVIFEATGKSHNPLRERMWLRASLLGRC